MKKTKKDLEAEVESLREMLQWYVDDDDVLEGPKWRDSNKYWIDRRHQALALLGVKECSRCGQEIIPG